MSAELLLKAMRRSDDAAWRVIEGEALVIDPKDSMIYPLNSAGTRIWELLDGTRNGSDIIAVIGGEFDCDGKTLERDVLSFLEELMEKGMITVCG